MILNIAIAIVLAYIAIQVLLILLALVADWLGY